MPVDEKKVTNMQNIFLENRTLLNVSGVVDVLNFDEQLITLDTELGVLIIKGSNLKLNKFNLDNTDLSVNGDINSIIYEDKPVGKSEGFITRIFK